nr:glucan endo-1,3-beta-glucosidase [Tanacetum cinerariifolium]
MTPVYDAGIFRHKVETTSPSYQAPVRGEPARSPVQRTDDGKTWCIPKTGAHEEDLQANIDYVCGLGLDCQPIREGGRCFYPKSVHAHAAYAMNVYYQATGRRDYDCDFSRTGIITSNNPSYGRCKY